MKRLVSLLAVMALILAGVPLPIEAAKAGQETGRISGTATAEGKPVPKATVRLRNTQTGQLVGTTTSDDRGNFEFTALPAGTYVVEVLSAAGAIIGTSAAVSLTAGAMVATGVTVGVSAAAVAAGAAAAAAGGGFFGTALGVTVVTAAVAGGVAAAVVAAQGEASPSR